MINFFANPIKALMYKGARVDGGSALSYVFIISLFFPLVTKEIYDAYQDGNIVESIKLPVIFFGTMAVFSVFLLIGYLRRKTLNPNNERLATIDSPMTKLAGAAAVFIGAFARYMGWW